MKSDDSIIHENRVLIEFYERRKGGLTIKFEDRRQQERRKTAKPVKVERRRLASVIRRYERELFNIPVCLHMDGNEISGCTHDITPEGLMVISEIFLNPGTALSLQFSFGDNVCYLNVAGQVVSCESLKNEIITKALRIKFSNIREFERNILVSAVQELKSKSTVQGNSLLKIVVSKDLLVQDLNLYIPKVLDEPHILPRPLSIHSSKIIGWGAYHPKKEVLSDDITNYIKSSGYKNVGKTVELLTGIKSRRYDTPDKFPSDLAAEASFQALRNAGIDAKDLDVIIFFGISKDFDEPATANVLQDKLGAKKTYAFDVGNACNGFVTAVDILDALIASGRCETGLIATGELISPYIDWMPRSKEDFKHTIFSYTIGDAGGAAVLTRVNKGEDRGIRARWFINDGSYWRLAIAGSLPGANPHDKFFKSKGLELELASIKCTPVGIQEILNLLKWDIDDIDLIIPHQIPISIQQNLYEKALGLPTEKLYWTFSKFGNNATASMPVAVCEALKEGRVKKGDKVLLLGAAAGYSAGIIGMVF